VARIPLCVVSNGWTEDDAPYYTAIRRLYVPTIFLGYVSCCTFASNCIGAESILPALELAKHLANEENAELAEDFVQTRQMEGFVRAMANASKVPVRLNQDTVVAAMAADGKSRRKRKEKRGRGWMGETVEVWDPTRIL
jgi:hypothetical protein